MKAFLTALLFCSFLSTAPAMAEVPSEFIVSGVLQSKDQELVVKLVQGVKAAATATDAANEFKGDVLQQYPGYFFLDIIASPLERTGNSCFKTTAI